VKLSALGSLLLVLVLPRPALAQSPPDDLRDRIPRFVNTAETSPNLRPDWVRAPDAAFPLRGPTEPFSVTYSHNGQTYSLADYLDRGDVLGFLILKGDQIVFEDYRHGTGPEDRFLSYSVSKSIVSTLIGVAIDEGHIGSVRDPVTSYLPFLARTGFDGSTVQDVLRMATNVDFSEEYGDANSGIGTLHRARGTGDPPFAEYMLSVPPSGPPGTEFRYQSVNTQILAMVLEAATGIRLNRYAERKLWQKIGAESDAYFLTGREQPGICAYGCFHARLRDYARFGLMSLRGGELGGSRVVGDAWMREATTPAPFAQPTTLDDGTGCRNGYAYQWWIPCGPPGAFRAIGISGQTIFIHPGRDVVIAQFSAWPQASVSPERRGEDVAVFEAIIDSF
jgi:CubicO group peptidase (beta-lactamase class C family)